MLKSFFYKAGGKYFLSKLIHNHILLYSIFMFLTLPKNRFGLECLSNLIENKIYKRLKRKYSTVVNQVASNKMESAKVNIIWFCWLQGIENAPVIVKNNYRKLQKYNADKTIIVITSENYDSYTSIPNFIIQKWKKGIISNTHFSDILRANLLVQNGGYWVDATVLFSDSIPTDIQKASFFCFRTLKPGCSGHRINVSSWFIYSNKFHPIMISVQNLLFAYWKKENRLCDYFLFHLFLEISLEKYECDVQNMPKYTNENPHILFYELNQKYTKELFSAILSKSFVHKLSYKIEPEINSKEGTFYSRIIKGDF